MMAGVVRRTPPPPLKLELEETGAILRKEEREELREEVETTSAGTAVRKATLHLTARSL